MDSLFDSNSAAVGGALCDYADESNSFVELRNSTLHSNRAVYEGGAIYQFKHSKSGFGAVEMHINNSTFVGNSASGVDSSVGQGGAVFTDSDVGTGNIPRLSILNSILWQDYASDTLSNSEVFIGMASVTTGTSDIEGGCMMGSTCAHIISRDPELSVLGNYFGFTPTMRPSAMSPVVNAGDDGTCESADQRGIARAQGPHCDMGAVELRFPSDDVESPAGF